MPQPVPRVQKMLEDYVRQRYEEISLKRTVMPSPNKAGKPKEVVREARKIITP